MGCPAHYGRFAIGRNHPRNLADHGAMPNRHEVANIHGPRLPGDSMRKRHALRRGARASGGLGRMGAAGSVARHIDNRVFGDKKRRKGDLLSLLILPDCRTVLDVGCGENGVLMDLVPGIPYSVGVDLVLPPDPPEGDRNQKRHDEYHRSDIRSLGEHFSPNSFDCVVALDVIEHLETEDGYALLHDMEHIASKRVIVYTPNGYLPQPPAPDNPYQEHISGWEVDEFLKLGYRVTGVHGWKPLRGPYSLPRWFPKPFWARISMLTESFFESRPHRAFQLLCSKDLVPPGRSAQT